MNAPSKLPPAAVLHQFLKDNDVDVPVDLKDFETMLTGDKGPSYRKGVYQVVTDIAKEQQAPLPESEDRFWAAYGLSEAQKKSPNQPAGSVSGGAAGAATAASSTKSPESAPDPLALARQLDTLSAPADTTRTAAGVALAPSPFAGTLNERLARQEAEVPPMPEVNLNDVAVAASGDEGMGGAVRSDLEGVDADQMAGAGAAPGAAMGAYTYPDMAGAVLGKTGKAVGDFLVGIYNAVGPKFLQALSGTEDYLLAAGQKATKLLTGREDPQVFAAQMRVQEFTNKAKEWEARPSDEAKQSILDHPESPSAWTHAIGAGAGSVGHVIATGGASALPMAVGDMWNGAKDAGASDDEALVLTSAAAPLVAGLDAVGAEAITGNPALMKLLPGALRRIILSEGKQVTAETAKSAAARLGAAAARRLKSAVGEGVTEAAQDAVELTAKALADAVRSGDEKPLYNVTAAGAGKQMLESGIVGGILGGAVGGHPSTSANTSLDAATPPASAPEAEATTDAALTQQEARVFEPETAPKQVVLQGNGQQADIPVTIVSDAGSTAVVALPGGQRVNVEASRLAAVPPETPAEPIQAPEPAPAPSEAPQAPADPLAPTPGTTIGPRIYAPAPDSGEIKTRKTSTSSVPGTPLVIQPKGNGLADVALNPADMARMVNDGPRNLSAYFDYDLPLNESPVVGFRVEQPGVLERTADGWRVREKGRLSFDHEDGRPSDLSTSFVPATAPGVPTKQAPLPADTIEANQAEPLPPKADKAPAPPALTPAQQAHNNALDLATEYKALTKAKRATKAGQALEQKLKLAAVDAGLKATRVDGGHYVVTKDGKRTVRFHETKPTSPHPNPVYLPQRSPEAQRLAEKLLTDADRDPSWLMGLGLGIKTADVPGIVKDIRDGKNTIRSQAALDAMEKATQQGFLLATKGSGLTMQRFEVPLDEYLNAAPDAAPQQMRPWSDEEVDAEIEKTPALRHFLAQIANPDGSLSAEKFNAELARLGNDPGFLAFMFDLPAESVHTVSRYFARQATTHELPPPPQPAAVEPAGAPPSLSPPASRRVAGEGDSAPAQTGQPGAEPELAADPLAAAQAEVNAIKARIAAKKAARKQAGAAGTLGANTFIDPELIPDYLDLLRAYIKFGVVKTSVLMQRLRDNDEDLADAPDEELRALVKQAKAEAGIQKKAQKPKPVADADIPTGETKTRQHGQRTLDAPGVAQNTKDWVVAQGLHEYTERQHGALTAVADRLLSARGIDDAIALIKPSSPLSGDVKAALTGALNQRLDADLKAAIKAGDMAAADGLNDKLNHVFAIDLPAGTTAGQTLAARRLITQYHPFAAIADVQKELEQQAAPVRKKAEKAKREIEQDLRKANGEAAKATMEAPAVQQAMDEAAEPGRPKSKKNIIQHTAEWVGGAVKASQRALREAGKNNTVFTQAERERRRAARNKPGAPQAMGITDDHLFEAGYLIEAGVRKFAEFSAHMIEEFGNGIKPYLPQLYREAKKRLETAGVDAGDVDVAAEAAAEAERNLADEVAGRVMAAVKPPKPGKVDPADQLVRTLTAKVREKLTAARAKDGRNPVKPKTDKEAFVAAITHRDQYAEIFEESKALVRKKIEAARAMTDTEKAQALQDLDGYFAEIIGKPYAQRQAQRVISEGVAGLKTRLDKIARESMRANEATKEQLTRRFVQEAGLSGARAEAVAEAIAREFDARVQAAREKTIANMAKRLNPVLGKQTKSALDRMRELLNTGRGVGEAADEVLAKHLEMPGLTTEQRVKLIELADAVEAAPEGFRKDRAVRDLLAEKARISGVGFWSILDAYLSNNMMSNYVGHGFNLVSTQVSTLTNLLTQTVSTAYHAKTNMRVPLMGYLAGLQQAPWVMGEILAEGDNRPDEKGRYGAPNALETIGAGLNVFDEAFRAAGIQEGTWGKVKHVTRSVASWVRIVSRAMAAADVLGSEATKEMRVWQLALLDAIAKTPDAGKDEVRARMLAKLYPGGMTAEQALEQAIADRPQATDKHWALAAEKLMQTSNRFGAAEAQAQAEGLDPQKNRREFRLRVYELVEQSRPVQWREAALQHSKEQTFNEDPKGAAGVLYHGLQFLVNKGVTHIAGREVKPLKSVFRFMRTAANVASRYADYSPVGFVRGIKGRSLVGDDQTAAHWSELDKTALMLKGSVPTMTALILYALLKDDEERKKANGFQIVARGPQDAQARKQWQAEGGMPYAIEYGEPGRRQYVSYMAWGPLAPMLASLGELRDAERYKGLEEGSTEWSEAAAKASFAMLLFAANQSSVRAQSDLLEATQSSEKMTTFAKKMVASNAKAAVPFSGSVFQGLRHFYEATGTPRKEALTLEEMLRQDLPFARTGLATAMDRLGNDVTVSNRRFASGAPADWDGDTRRIMEVLQAKDIVLRAYNRKEASLLVPDMETKQERPMDNRQWEAFNRASGKWLKQALLSALPDLEKANREDAQRLVRHLSESATRIGKMEVGASFGKLR